MHRFTNLKSPVSVLVAFALVAQSTAMAAPKPVELKWSELGSTIQGRTINLTLPGGITVGGDVTVVRDESLVLNVHKTSDSKAFPKGNATIPKASVTVLSLTETRGRWGRKMGSGLGTLTGVLAGGYIAANTASSAGSGLAIFGVIAGAGTLGGYYLGKAADTRDTLIRVVP
jgi:hypothetical protein